jgi:predicted DNA-binding protein
VPASRSNRISINLTPELHAQLRTLASQEGRSISNLCAHLIEASLGRRNRGA